MKRLNKVLSISMVVIIILASSITSSWANTSKVSIQFKDTKPTDWYTEVVSKLVELGIIDSYTDNTFRPNNSIKRDEFIKLTVASMGYQLDERIDYWAQPYINKAIELELIGKNEFTDYKVNITREEMTSIIVNAALKTTDSVSNANTYDLIKVNISDYNKVSDKYKQQILYAYDLGIVTGYDDGTVRPKNNATRAEASTVIMRYLDKSLRSYPTINIGYVELKEYNTESYWYNSFFLDYMKVYPPMRNGKQYTEFIEVAQVLKDNIDKTKKFGIVGYEKPVGNVRARFFNIPNEEEFQAHVNKNPNYVGIDIQDMDISIQTIDWDMSVGHHRKYPYEITIGNVDNYNAHAKALEVVFKELFGKDSPKAIEELNKQLEANKKGLAENTIENKDGLSKYDKAFNFNNRRIVMESRSGNRVDIYVSPILK